MEYSVEAVRREDTKGEPGQLGSAEHLDGGEQIWKRDAHLNGGVDSLTCNLYE
jgi:hypothetical protein